MTKKFKVILMFGVAAVATVGIVAGASAHSSAPHQRPTVTMNAQWAFKPASLAQAKAEAQQIVAVKVISVAAGPDIVTQAKGEPDGVSRIPTQRIAVTVQQSFKGTAKAGDTLSLFQTGGVVSTAIAGDTHPRWVLDGDPFYTAGEQYVLLLVPGPQGTLRIVAPEGRYKIDAKGGLSSAASGLIVAEVKAKGLAAFTG